MRRWTYSRDRPRLPAGCRARWGAQAGQGSRPGGLPRLRRPHPPAPDASPVRTAGRSEQGQCDRRAHASPAPRTAGRDPRARDSTRCAAASTPTARRQAQRCRATCWRPHRGRGPAVAGRPQAVPRAVARCPLAAASRSAAALGPGCSTRHLNRTAQAWAWRSARRPSPRVGVRRGACPVHPMTGTVPAAPTPCRQMQVPCRCPRVHRSALACPQAGSARRTSTGSAWRRIPRRSRPARSARACSARACSARQLCRPRSAAPRSSLACPQAGSPRRTSTDSAWRPTTPRRSRLARSIRACSARRLLRPRPTALRSSLAGWHGIRCRAGRARPAPAKAQ
jgi:hypothetical protein